MGSRCDHGRVPGTAPSPSSGRGRARAALVGPWLRVALGVLALGTVAHALHVPAGWLLAGLAVGLAVALSRGHTPALPDPLLVAAQAAIGAALGARAQPAVLAEVSRELPAVVGVALGTLGLSVLAGLVLARFTSLDRPTAVLGMLAGAAEGVVVVSQEARADARLVAVMQYLRVVLVVASVPLFAGVLFEVGRPVSPAASGAPGLGVLGFVLVAVVGGVAGRVLRLPIGALVGPLVLGALASAVGVPLVTPPAAAAGALAVIGLSVGLTFDADALRHAGRLLPAMLGGVAIVVGGSGVLAVGLARWAGVDGLTAYLATSPGGLNAVLATAYDTGAVVGFVLAVQVLRFLVFVAAAPLLASRWSTRPEPA